MSSILHPPSGDSVRLCAADDLAVHCDSGLRIAWGGESDWLGPIAIEVSDPVAHRDYGSDDLGRYEEWRWSVAAQPVAVSVRAYERQSLLVFQTSAVGDIASNLASGVFQSSALSWPKFHPAHRLPGGSPELRSFGYQHAEFAMPAFGDGQTNGFFFAPHRPPVVGPLLFLAPDGRCLFLAPLDQFHEQTIGVPGDDDPSIRCGWHGDLAEVPNGFTSSFAVWAARDPRTAMNQWGDLLLRRNQTRRLSRYADVLSARLSYWTDNGAVYYYRTAAGCDYTETLVRAVDGLREQNVPIASLQIDSWFYPHEQLREVGPEGAPIVPPTGGMRWEPRADLFPEGFTELNRRLGNLPLSFHNRHFSKQSPYFEKFAAWVDGDYAHPQGPGLYEMLLSQAAQWGAIVYEQDWMVETFFGIRPLRAVPGRARAWQEALDRAAGENGLHLQWCMSTPADFMQSTTLANLGSIRTSGDYRYLFDNGLNWVWFLHVNALARALGLWPYKDVFVSHGPTENSPGEPYAEIEAMLAALSGGPVGIGDEIGATNRELVMRTCREDGILLKPDVPLAATAACFQGNRFTEPELLIGETYSQHPAGRWIYVTTFNAFQGRQTIVGEVGPAQLGDAAPDGPVIVFDWRRRQWQRLEPGQGWNLSLEFQDWDYRVLCPVLPGERAVFGDISKYVTVADHRLRIACEADGLELRVLGVPGELAEIRGWSAASPRGARLWLAEGARELPESASGEGWQWHRETGEWCARARIGTAGYAEITLR